MPHYRERFIKERVKKALSLSTVVGLVGQRQVGKTTFSEKLSNSTYVSLDDIEQLQLANSAPNEFINQKTKLLVIDECQKAPPLFPAIKLQVQKNNRPGQFLLTGSVRFTARKAIQESLTGRIINLEMLPLSMAEMHHLPLQDFTKWTKYDSAILKKQLETRVLKLKSAPIENYLRRGGLPGMWFLRDEHFLHEKMKSHIETLLQRDIQLIIETTVPYENLLEFMRFLAARQGDPFSYAVASRATHISVNTLKKILFAFESMFLVRRVLGMSYTKAPSFYFEDQGMASYLFNSIPSGDFQRFAFSQLFAQAHYNYMGKYELKYFESKGGAMVPLAFHIDDKWYGFIINLGNSLRSSQLKSAESFLANVKNAHVIFLDANSNNFEKISNKILRVPLLHVV